MTEVLASIDADIAGIKAVIKDDPEMDMDIYVDFQKLLHQLQEKKARIKRGEDA